MPPKKPQTSLGPKAPTSQPSPSALDVPFSRFLTVSDEPICAEQYLSATDTPTPLVNWINSMDCLPFGISNIPNDPKGRCAVATADISAGTTLICEHSPLWVVSVASLNDFCHNCGTSCEAAGQAATQHDPSGLYTWCSLRCKEETAAFFAVEQHVFPAYQSIQRVCEIDLDLLRLAVKYLILKYFRNKAQQESTPTIATAAQPDTNSNTDTKTDANTETPYLQSHPHVVQGVRVIAPTLDHIDSLQLHIQHQEDAGVLVTTKRTIQHLYPTLARLVGGTFLPTLYPSSATTDSAATTATTTTTTTATSTPQPYFASLEADLLGITGRINANIHSLQTYQMDPSVPLAHKLAQPPGSAPTLSSPELASQLNQARLAMSKQPPFNTFQPPTQYGMGLYPICAMINHSCEPNAIFINQGQSLCIRTVAPIKRGEEITVNYVSLNNDAIQRRYELLAEKGFWCGCRRCLFEIEEAQILLPLDAPASSAAASSSSSSSKQSTPANNKGKGAGAKTAAATTTPTAAAESSAIPSLRNDPTNSFNKADLCHEKLIRLLMDRFVANSLKSAPLALMEASNAIIPTNLALDATTFALLHPDNFAPAVLDAHPILKPMVLALFAFLDKHCKVLTAEAIVEQLVQESTSINTLFESSAKQLRISYHAAKKQQQKQQQSPPQQQQQQQDQNQPETQPTQHPEAELAPLSHPEQVLDGLTTGDLMTKINKLYPGGLHFPFFAPPTSHPSLTDHFFPTLHQSLCWVATTPTPAADPSTASGSPTATTTTTASLRHSFLILLVNASMNLLFNQALEAVQNPTLALPEKRKKIERFSSFRHFLYPISLHHNQYQIMMLLSNLITAACPNVALFAGCKVFFTTVLPSATLLFSAAVYQFPTIFLSLMEICQYAWSNLTKADDLIGRYSSGPNSNPVTKKFVETMKPVVAEAKKHILRRMSAVVRTTYGPHHIQNFYFAQLK